MILSKAENMLSAICETAESKRKPERQINYVVYLINSHPKVEEAFHVIVAHKGFMNAVHFVGKQLKKGVKNDSRRG